MKTKQEIANEVFRKHEQSFVFCGYQDAVLDAMEEYAQERTKDCYPKEFLTWAHTDNNVQLTFRENIPQWWLHSPELNYRQMTLEDLFLYWKDNIK